MKLINCKIVIVIFLCSFSTNSLFSQNQLWIRDLTKDKKFLLPKRNYETYFRISLSKYPLLNDSILQRLNINNSEFPYDSGYVGSPYEYVGARNDSLLLELDPYWRKGMIIPVDSANADTSIVNNGHTFLNTYYFPNSHIIALNDITEIQIQRTYSKFSEQVWVYGGLLGSGCILVSPLVYFLEDKKAGIGLFATGVVGVTASLISYKMYFGYREFKKPHFEFFWDQ